MSSVDPSQRFDEFNLVFPFFLSFRSGLLLPVPVRKRRQVRQQLQRKSILRVRKDANLNYYLSKKRFHEKSKYVFGARPKKIRTLCSPENNICGMKTLRLRALLHLSLSLFWFQGPNSICRADESIKSGIQKEKGLKEKAHTGKKSVF